MVELFPDVSEERKEYIRKGVNFLFSVNGTTKTLPEQLNDYVSSFSSIDEQEFADFLITVKFLELQGEEE